MKALVARPSSRCTPWLYQRKTSLLPELCEGTAVNLNCVRETFAVAKERQGSKSTNDSGQYMDRMLQYHASD